MEIKKLRAGQTSQHLTTRTTRKPGGAKSKPNEQPLLSGAPTHYLGCEPGTPRPDLRIHPLSL
eukprot:284396-Pyramimonas_sp.AAC.2